MTQLNKPVESAHRPTVLISGCAGGMGRALVETCIAEGWRVCGIDHNEDRLPALGKTWNAEGHFFEKIELTDPSLDQKLSDLLSKIGHLNGLVNLAGISIGDEIERLTDTEWEQSLSVNVTAPMRLCRLAVPYLEKNGGSIVNVGSPVGFIGARKPSYAASKAALHGLTMSLARNLGSKGVRANLVLPGACQTGMTADWNAEKRERVAAGTFLKRLCDPKEVATVILFLLGNGASYVTGSVMDMTAGGMWGH